MLENAEENSAEYRSFSKENSQHEIITGVEVWTRIEYGPNGRAHQTGLREVQKNQIEAELKHGGNLINAGGEKGKKKKIK